MTEIPGRNLFKARPGVHMEFIAKSSIDLPDTYTVDQDATNYLWGIVPWYYTQLFDLINSYIKKQKLPGRGSGFWVNKYVIVYKFIPEMIRNITGVIPTGIDNTLIQSFNKRVSWKLLAMLPNMSYPGSFDQAAIKIPPKVPIHKELVLGIRQKKWYEQSTLVPTPRGRRWIKE